MWAHLWYLCKHPKNNSVLGNPFDCGHVPNNLLFINFDSMGLIYCWWCLVNMRPNCLCLTPWMLAFNFLFADFSGWSFCCYFLCANDKISPNFYHELVPFLVSICQFLIALPPLIYPHCFCLPIFLFGEANKIFLGQLPCDCVCFVCACEVR